MKTLTSLFIALLLSSTTLLAQTSDPTETVITVGDKIQNTLTSESIHGYTIELESDHFVYGFADQESVDVVVTIYNPEGNKIAEFDGPARGKETFQFETKSGGVYRIEAAPFEEGEGDYTILVSVAEPIASDPAGRFYSEEIETLYTVVLKDGSLFLRNYQMDEDLELSAASEDMFGSEFPLTSVHFVRNENGEVTGFKASSGRTRDVLFEKWD